MMPMGATAKEIEEELPKFLDELQKYDMKVVLLFGEVGAGYYKAHGEEAFRAKFTEIYEKYGKHPAVLGFYPGEEPGSEVIDNFATILKIMADISK
jgi:flavodoxin